MGTWGPGPFDNDTAADWRFDFLDLSPAAQEAELRAAFDGVAPPAAASGAPPAVSLGDSSGDLPGDDEVLTAIAASAVVAEAALAPADLRASAVRVLDRILATLPPGSDRSQAVTNLRKSLSD